MSQTAPISDVQAQILSNRFDALAREGAEVFTRMARSPAVFDEGQYACAILDAEARLIAQDQGEPSQLCAVQATVAHLIDAFAFNIADEDVILTGDPYCGGTFGGTLTLTVPVSQDGEIAYFVALRFGVADLAGDVPGVFQPEAHEIWQEALRVPPVKLMRDGSPQKDVRRYILKNSRAPEQLDSDLTTAAVAARRVAARLGEMIAERGAEAVKAAAAHRIDYARARMESFLVGLTQGIGHADLPGDGQVKVTVGRSDTGKLHVDFSGTTAQIEGSSNLTGAATQAIVLTQIAADLIEDAGLSQGLLDALHVTLPASSRVNASFPSAVSLGWRQVAPAVSEALAMALGQEAAIAPPPPMMVLFNAIGTTPVTLPLILSPGYSPLSGACGGDAASGRRRLISAEQTEIAGVLRVLRREFDEAGGISAEVLVRQAGQEAIIVPGVDPAPIISQSGPLERERSNVLSLDEGASVQFVYAPRAGECHDG